MENNDGIINQCAKIQINQQKMINQIKDTLNDKNQIIEKVISYKSVKGRI